MGVCGQVDGALDSRSEGLGFDSQCWSCVEVLGKLRNGYVVHSSKVGLIVAAAVHPLPWEVIKSEERVVTWISRLNRYLYCFQAHAPKTQ